MQRRLMTVVIICVVALFMCGVAGFAQDYEGNEENTGEEEAHPYFTERLQISVGAFFPNFNTDVKLDGDSGLIGSTIDFEKILGLDDELATLYAHLMWRMNNKHRLEFTYYNIDRDGTKVLGATINFGDQTYTVNTSMDSSLDMSVYRLGYDYSFINNGKIELGVGLSADIIPADFSVSAVGGLSESESALLVIPTVGIHAAYALTDKLAVMGRFQGLAFDVENADGNVINCMLGFEYDAFEHFAVGAAYSYYDFDVEVDAGGFNGSIAFVYRGPLAYGKLHF